MLKVGITGGIGSGKSIVCDLFTLMGIPVFNSDLVARKLLTTDPRILGGIVSLFGTDVLQADGSPDRKKIGALVFADKAALDALNGLVHPAVFLAFYDWADGLGAGIPYCIKEAAIMFESGSAKQNDVNVLVFSDLETRIGRVTRRDGFSREQVLSRISQQMSETEKLKLADEVIYNDREHSLIEQVMELDKIFRNFKRNILNS